MKWSVILFLYFVASTVYAAISEGESIYLDGKTRDGQVLKAHINDLESGAALSCANCHRESGLGTSESGKTIPPVSWSFLGKNQPEDNSSRFYSIQNKRKAYDVKLLHRVLTVGINSNGEATDPLMPRYVISEKQTEQLLEYLKTLYAGDDPGVDSEVLKVATFVDPRLTAQQKQQHFHFIQSLFDMKNSQTRGELRRKQFSPVQKKPQYESYRHWQLISWELPDDPDLWKESLTQQYLDEPVFVILSPLIKDNYSGVGAFCKEMNIPCLLAYGTNNVQGDYFNFVYRDTQKQQRDYLAKKIREQKNKLLYFDASGQLKNLQTPKISFPQTNEISNQLLQAKFDEVCGTDSTIIIKTDIGLVQKLYKLKCPVKQKLKIMMIHSNSTGYQEISDFLVEYSSPNICWVTDYGRMLERNTRKIRSDVLTKKFGMENTDSESMLMNLYSFSLLADSIHQLAGNFSRAYLLEIIEHMLNSFPNFTYFNSVSGAPNQRSIVGPIGEFCPSVVGSSS